MDDGSTNEGTIQNWDIRVVYQLLSNQLSTRPTSTQSVDVAGVVLCTNPSQIITPRNVHSMHKDAFKASCVSPRIPQRNPWWTTVQMTIQYKVGIPMKTTFFPPPTQLMYIVREVVVKYWIGRSTGYSINWFRLIQKSNKTKHQTAAYIDTGSMLSSPQRAHLRIFTWGKILDAFASKVII